MQFLKVEGVNCEQNESLEGNNALKLACLVTSLMGRVSESVKGMKGVIETNPYMEEVVCDCGRAASKRTLRIDKNFDGRFYVYEKFNVFVILIIWPVGTLGILVFDLGVIV